MPLCLINYIYSPFHTAMNIKGVKHTPFHPHIILKDSIKQGGT